ncbi:MAG TPA: hypothetical protein ENH82_20255 [bacterium]|nr:hypothetical protein [bacterium]
MDFSKVKTIPIKNRKHKVNISCLGNVPEGVSFADFYDSLPDILGAHDIKKVSKAVARASREGHEVILAMGAHPVKCGLSRIIIDLMESGILTCIALNGAGSLHDFELSYIGETSEDVTRTLQDGSFGMVEETGKILNEAMESGLKENRGAGESTGNFILNSGFNYSDISVQAAGARLGIDVTVHIAIGTDTIHVHPKADGGVLGKATFIDLKKFTDHIAKLEGGVYINLGSAVMLPEVFLKVLSAVRNMGHKVYNFTTVNMDMNHHYRPTENVLKRPEVTGAQAFNLIGQHEIMLPLLASSIMIEKERL